jgi:hypothetical protein
MVDPWTEAIKEAYASAPHELILDTLEFRHSTFSEPQRLVNDVKDWTLKLEADAPEDPSTLVLFTAIAFEVSMPSSEEDSLPELAISVDNVAKTLLPHLTNAVKVMEPITLIYRQYLASDINTVQYKLEGLTIRKTTTNRHRVIATASFFRLQDMLFPSKVYTLAEFPGLQT